MKLLTFIPFIFALPTEYDEDLCEEVPDLCDRNIRDVMYMIHDAVDTQLSVRDLLYRMKSYGCHCFQSGRGNSDVSGTGPPVDAIDAACQSLQKCRKCVGIDFPTHEGGKEFNNHDGTYHTNHDQQSASTAGAGFVRQCLADRNNEAEQALCECDLQFAKDLGNAWSDDAHNGFYWLTSRNVRNRNGDVFDHEATCQCQGSNCNRHADACCGGGYPFMYPYQTSTNVCCNGELKTIGSC